MQRFLLDTNHLSETLQPVSRMRDLISQARREGHVLATTWGVLCEIEAGIARLRRPERARATVSSVLSHVRIWPIDWRIVRGFGSVSLAAQKKGRALSHVDKFLSPWRCNTMRKSCRAIRISLPFLKSMSRIGCEIRHFE